MICKICAHRYRLLFLALLRQILDAIDKEFVGADVDSAGFYHPSTELHQLVEEMERIIFKNGTEKKIPCTGLLYNAQILIEFIKTLNKTLTRLKFFCF